jgi:maleylacetate reductase
MDAFTYEAQPGRVVFGAGTLASLPAEAECLGFVRALVVCTPGRRAMADQAVKDLGAAGGGVFDGAIGHVSAAVAGAGCDEARRVGADGTVALGGGAALGVAKVIARDLGLPIIAVPTTYSGSEMTAIWGITEDALKRTGHDPSVLPRTVIYDPELTAGLPASVGVPSAFNAIAHSVEALYAENANPVTSLVAEDGIRALAHSLPIVVQTPGDIAARGEALYGAWLCGAALGGTGTALHHKLCHVLGGTFDLPHAEVHSIILPHATAYNRVAAPEAMDRIARALGADEAAGALYDLLAGLGAKTGLGDLGMARGDLDKATEIATGGAFYNPAPVTHGGVRALLEDAWHGRRPAAPGQETT